MQHLINQHEASTNYLVQYSKILHELGYSSTEAKSFYKQHKTNKKFRQLAKVLERVFLNRQEILSQQ